MDIMTHTLLGFFVLGTVAARPTLEFAKNWNNDQKAAWNTIETHWQHITKGEVEEFVSYIHPDFTGFGHESPLLIDKASIAKWVGFWGKNINIPVYDLQPVSVSAFGNFAVVHYYLFALEMHGEKSVRTVRRYTTTLIKEKEKWLVIANQNALLPSDW